MGLPPFRDMVVEIVCGCAPLFVLDLVAGVDRCTETGVVCWLKELRFSFPFGPLQGRKDTVYPKP